MEKNISALAEDLSLVPSTHFGQLTSAWESSLCGLYMYVHIFPLLTYNKNNKNKSSEDKSLLILFLAPCFSCVSCLETAEYTNAVLTPYM